jgi:uncharacterized protein YndB with AHSA1/START domain
MEPTCGVRLTRHYRATPPEVWSALTNPASMARWLAPVVAADLSPGGTIELSLDGGAALRATVIAVEEGRLLELDWPGPNDTRSVVRFELRTEGDGTALALDHTQIEARIGMRVMRIWERSVGRLDAVLGEADT